MMVSRLRRLVLVVVVLLVGIGLVRGAMFKFQEKENAIREGCRADLQKQGIARDAARAKFPTPEISGVTSGCLTPGQTGEVVVNGRFSPGTRFLLKNDNIQVVKESLVGSTYRATVTVAAGIGPQTASVSAFAPLTCVSASLENAVVILAGTEWTMDASNGWRVVARPAGKPACGPRTYGDFPYEVTFFRKGEAAPFAKRTAVLHYNMYDTNEPYSLRLEENTAAASGAQDFMALMQKMQDPKLTDAQRDQLMKDVEKMQTQMQANIAKMADPAYQKKMDEERQNFGCRNISAGVDAALAVKGRMFCADKVGTLKLTGTVKFLP